MAALQPVILWQDGDDTITAGTSWLRVATAGGQTFRLNGSDAVLDLAQGLETARGRSAVGTPLPVSTPLGLSIDSGSEFSDVVRLADGRLFSLSNHAADEIRRWFSRGAQPEATINGDWVLASFGHDTLMAGGHSFRINDPEELLAILLDTVAGNHTDRELPLSGGVMGRHGRRDSFVISAYSNAGNHATLQITLVNLARLAVALDKQLRPHPKGART